MSTPLIIGDEQEIDRFLTYLQEEVLARIAFYAIPPQVVTILNGYRMETEVTSYTPFSMEWRFVSKVKYLDHTIAFKYEHQYGKHSERMVFRSATITGDNPEEFFVKLMLSI